MTTLEMADSSTPVVPPAQLPVYAFYIGGDTPHPWADIEIRALKARWVLPIFVNTNPGADAAAHARDIIGWLHAHGWAPGTAVCIDTESVPMDGYLAELDRLITAAGYLLVNYESKGPLPSNPLTSGGRWIADWTGLPHLYPGSVATQYADAAMAGRPWDSSVILTSVPLHQLNPPATHRIRGLTVTVIVPELGRGDEGQAVRRMQHLLIAWKSDELAASGPDGIFGPETAAALRSFQRIYGIDQDPGICTLETWQRLIEG